MSGLPTPSNLLAKIYKGICCLNERIENIAPETNVDPVFTRDVCYDSGCGGFVTYTVDNTGSVTILNQFFDDFTDAASEVITTCCDC